jgi:hypothetical protein
MGGWRLQTCRGLSRQRSWQRADTGNVRLIEAGYNSQKSSGEKAYSKAEHVTVMSLLPLPVLFVCFLLFATLSIRFYSQSVDNEGLTNWRNTSLWIVSSWLGKYRVVYPGGVVGLTLQRSPPPSDS